MNKYTVTVKPNSDAFAAILRYDPEVVIEFETGDENAETYTVTSALPLHTLLDNAPGLVEWDVLQKLNCAVYFDERDVVIAVVPPDEVPGELPGGGYIWWPGTGATREEIIADAIRACEWQAENAK